MKLLLNMPVKHFSPYGRGFELAAGPLCEALNAASAEGKNVQMIPVRDKVLLLEISEIRVPRETEIPDEAQYNIPDEFKVEGVEYPKAPEPKIPGGQNYADYLAGVLPHEETVVEEAEAANEAGGETIIIPD